MNDDRQAEHVYTCTLPGGSSSVVIPWVHASSQGSSCGSMKEQILEQNPTIYHCQRVPAASRLLQERVAFFKGTRVDLRVPLAPSYQHLRGLFSDHEKNNVCLKEAAN